MHPLQSFLAWCHDWIQNELMLFMSLSLGRNCGMMLGTMLCISCAVCPAKYLSKKSVEEICLGPWLWFHLGSSGRIGLGSDTGYSLIGVTLNNFPADLQHMQVPNVMYAVFYKLATSFYYLYSGVILSKNSWIQLQPVLNGKGHIFLHVTGWANYQFAQLCSATRRNSYNRKIYYCNCIELNWTFLTLW